MYYEKLLLLWRGDQHQGNELQGNNLAHQQQNEETVWLPMSLSRLNKTASC